MYLDMPCLRGRARSAFGAKKCGLRAQKRKRVKGGLQKQPQTSFNSFSLLNSLLSILKHASISVARILSSHTR